MKYAGIIILAYLFLPVLSFTQGTTCGTAFTIPVDGTTNNYTISATTGSTSTCVTNSVYNGTGRYTYFKFTSNASASCVLISISTSGNQAAEVVFYSSSSCNSGAHVASCDMCFNTGSGIWAPSETYTMLASHVYYLRVWTPGTGTITLAAQNYTPPNTVCLGATAIGPTPISDNNACAKPGTGILPWQLCAGSLENTVFYTYTVASTGTSAINISNISCNNGDNDNNNGMQVGFFTGLCASLTWVSCATPASGANVTATTSSLAAGTKVLVAIDGFAGSNCSFNISATNSEPLAATIKYFSGWKTPTSNILKWVSLQELDNDHYEVQRSENGRDFVTIGSVQGERASYSEKTYQLEDRNPVMKAYYRLRQVDINGREKFFKTISVTRTELPYIDLSFPNPLPNNLLLTLQANFIGEADMKIISMSGQVVYKDRIRFIKGDNTYFRGLADLATGKYVLVVETEMLKVSKSLIKGNSPFSIK